VPVYTAIEHLDDNLDAGTGAPPDASMRRRMAEFFDQL